MLTVQLLGLGGQLLLSQTVHLQLDHLLLGHQSKGVDGSELAVRLPSLEPLLDLPAPPRSGALLHHSTPFQTRVSLWVTCTYHVFMTTPTFCALHTAHTYWAASLGMLLLAILLHYRILFAADYLAALPTL